MGGCSPAEIPLAAESGAPSGGCAENPCADESDSSRCGCSRLVGPEVGSRGVGFRPGLGGRSDECGRCNCVCGSRTVCGGSWVRGVSGVRGDSDMLETAFRWMLRSGFRRSRLKAHRGGRGDDVSWGTWALAWFWITAFILSTPPVAANSTDEPQTVCQSVDIRNSVGNLEHLAGCRVVEGFVQIVLIDNTDESSFANVTFPELREITGYLLLYRVNGLKSLARMFPNLAVIRGHQLFFNYALVIFEMLQLQEIGLYSLTDILRGAVYVVKNPMLCYHDSIDWDALNRNSSKEEHVITNNRNVNECPGCPSPSSCSIKPITNPQSKEPYCWNSQHCQKICPSECNGRSCNKSGACCHENCLGGCDAVDDFQSCFACRDVIYDGKCIKHCPDGTFLFMNRRCIPETECYNMPMPREIPISKENPWKPFQNECVLECPNDYMEVKETKNVPSLSDKELYTCKKCGGVCVKTCPGANVDSIASIQKLQGCTKINGALEIQIRGGVNVVKELEKSLSTIEEIDHYLKIVRSFPLVSLNFFKKLKIIHGQKLESGKYALVVIDNQNLDQLWDWSLRENNLTISEGRLFFHFNPKLCYSIIEDLGRRANLGKFDELEVARSSNGDKVACNMTELKAFVSTIEPKAVVISWNPFNHYDMRAVLGYVIYYIEAPDKNVSLFDGRDACGGDGWQVDDEPVEEGLTEQSVLITHLQPFTQYAYYVKTYTIATENNGARSPIQYFRTKPYKPSAPINLRAYSNSSSEIVITWQPPVEPNGNVTHYMVTGTLRTDDPAYLGQRNYCNYPIPVIEKSAEQHLIDESPTKPTNEKTLCEAKKEKGKEIITDQEIVQSQIAFENFLQNIIYVKRPTRERREISDKEESNIVKVSSKGKQDDSLESALEKTLTTEMSELEKAGGFFRDVYGETLLVVRGLHHFSSYTVEVKACRELVEGEFANKSDICSVNAIASVRTLKLDSADILNEPRYTIQMTNRSQSQVKLEWNEPANPNGWILTYQIDYRRVDIENSKFITECITNTAFQGRNKEYVLYLHSGNYSLRLRANSLAGYGEFTPEIYFYIEETGNTFVSLVIILLFIFILVIVTGLCIRRKYGNDFPSSKLIASVNPEYVPTHYTADEWEVPRENIEIIRELGQGSFGMVYEGIAKNIVPDEPEKPCAVKTVNEFADGRERVEFLNEASVMKAFNTHHVVKLLGVVTIGQPILVVMELMRNGDLKSYLRSHRPPEESTGETGTSSLRGPFLTLLRGPTTMTPTPVVGPGHGKHPPTLQTIMRMAAEIADGMAFLSAKRFVHRDLAARNCMVAEDLTVKIGDFGMTREIYETDYYRKEGVKIVKRRGARFTGTKGLLPVRWMAPESLKDGVFTSQSDVWSYGVVLWEMATLASQPYQGLSNDQVLRYVREGGIMERPDTCPDKFYDLMKLCWEYKPNNRPTFMELVSHFLSDVGNDFKAVSFYHSDEANELRRNQKLIHEQDQLTPLRVSRSIEDFSLTSDEEEQAEEEAAVEDTYTQQQCSSGSSKMSNGSTTPTANGNIFARHNGNSSATQTTKC